MVLRKPVSARSWYVSLVMSYPYVCSKSLRTGNSLSGSSLRLYSSFFDFGMTLCFGLEACLSRRSVLHGYFSHADEMMSAFVSGL